MSIANDDAPTDNGLLLLDDEEDFKLVSAIDSTHNFLNFSRRVAEATSMKRPVDIQLGIACGKDLQFSRSPLKGKSLLTPLSSGGPAKLDDNINADIHLPVKITPAVSNEPTVKRKNHLSLDRLVKDVLVHIESCPEHIAYSDDLVRLKPKLEAYSYSRQKVL